MWIVAALATEEETATRQCVASPEKEAALLREEAEEAVELAPRQLDEITDGMPKPYHSFPQPVFCNVVGVFCADLPCAVAPLLLSAEQAPPADPGPPTAPSTGTEKGTQIATPLVESPAVGPAPPREEWTDDDDRLPLRTLHRPTRVHDPTHRPGRVLPPDPGRDQAPAQNPDLVRYSSKWIDGNSCLFLLLGGRADALLVACPVASSCLNTRTG
jgi:hypothetical protein